MSYTDQPTTLAEALQNLTEENWHTERKLIEQALDGASQRMRMARDFIWSRRAELPEEFVLSIIPIFDADPASVFAKGDDRLVRLGDVLHALRRQDRDEEDPWWYQSISYRTEMDDAARLLEDEFGGDA